jgi:hypothetical protein
MKTQVFKNSEPVKSSESLMVFTMIVFWGLLLFASENSYVLFKNGKFNLQVKPKNGLQFEKMNKPENAVENENSTIQNPALEIEFSMAKMQNYLIPEAEPELEVDIAKSNVFPEVEGVKFSAADNTLGVDNFLKELQNQANEKTNKAVEYYALKKKIKECLSVDTEMPLKLENWMMDEKQWSYK